MSLSLLVRLVEPSGIKAYGTGIALKAGIMINVVINAVITVVITPT
jgi:hypothetical protein